MDWLGERTRSRIANETLEGKHFNPNDFDHSLAAKSTLASFQSTFCSMLKMKLLKSNDRVRWGYLGLKWPFCEMNRAPSQKCGHIEDLFSFPFFNLKFEYFILHLL